MTYLASSQALLQTHPRSIKVAQMGKATSRVLPSHLEARFIHRLACHALLGTIPRSETNWNSDNTCLDPVSPEFSPVLLQCSVEMHTGHTDGPTSGNRSNFEI